MSNMNETQFVVKVVCSNVTAYNFSTAEFIIKPHGKYDF